MSDAACLPCPTRHICHGSANLLPRACVLSLPRARALSLFGEFKHTLSPDGGQMFVTISGHDLKSGKQAVANDIFQKTKGD